MGHRHKKLTVEVNGDEEDGVPVVYSSENWLEKNRVVLAIMASLFVSGGAFILWAEGHYVTKNEMKKHEDVDVVTKDDFKRHEGIFGHAGMQQLAVDIRVQLERIQTDLGYVRKDVAELQQANKDRDRLGGNGRNGK